MSAPRIRRAAELAEQWVQEGVAQNLVVLVARRGRVVLEKAFGRLTPAADSPPTPIDALFDTQSLSKVFTATLVMILVEEGRVGLNRPVVDYIPEFKGEGKDAVLVRHLLTHTSGLRSEDVEKFAKETQEKIDVPRPEETLHPLLSEYFARRYGCPLWKPAGVEMSYCPFGMDVLGEIIRRVSGMSLDRFSRERLFRPLGMKNTSWSWSALPATRRVRRPPDPVVDSDPYQKAQEMEGLCWGSGGALTTARNMAIFGQTFLNGGAYGRVRILSPKTAATMTQNQIPGISAVFGSQIFPEATWGLGWSVHGSKTGECGGLYSSESYEHWGAGGVYSWVDPRNEIVGVYFSTAPFLQNLEEFSTNFKKFWRSDIFTDVVTAAVEEG